MSAGYIRAWPRYVQSDWDVRRIYPRLSDIGAIGFGCPPDTSALGPVTCNRNQIDTACYAAIGISISSAGGLTATLGLNQNRNITKITADPIAGINQIDLQSCVITPFAPTV